MSLICDENWVRHSSVGENAFKQAFKSCANIDIPSGKNLFLSAETLGTSCYESMFFGCTNLTKTPILPSTTLARSCYRQMFEECTKLETVPADLLPATILAEYCYYRMFYHCTKMTSAPDLLAPDPVIGCYYEMFRTCSSLTSAKCLMYLTSDQRTTNPETMGQINWYSVFNKWFKEINTTGRFEKRSDMTFPSGANSLGGIPASWTPVNTSDSVPTRP